MFGVTRCELNQSGSIGCDALLPGTVAGEHALGVCQALRGWRRRKGASSALLATVFACNSGVALQVENRYGTDAAYVDLRGTASYRADTVLIEVRQGVDGLKHIAGRVDSVRVGLAIGDFFGPQGAWEIVQQGESVSIHVGPDSEVALPRTTLHIRAPEAPLREGWIIFTVHVTTYGPGRTEFPATNYAAADTTVTTRLLQAAR